MPHSTKADAGFANGMIGAVAQGIHATRSFGAPWMARRLLYEVRVRSGVHRMRFRQRSWDDQEAWRWLSPDVGVDGAMDFEPLWRREQPGFLFDPVDRERYSHRMRQLLTPTDRERLCAQADNIGIGLIPYFSSRTAELGFPPEWHKNPFNGWHAPAAAHWTRVRMWSDDYGDLKYIWEAGRFGFAYTLARAYWLTGDLRYPEIFWQIVESWRVHNPPNTGSHWKCGQEVALRLMAWCFAVYAFADARPTTPERLWLLIGMIGAQAQRIDKDHIYSELQANNHAISEGVGLWAVGVLFPWFQRSRYWRERGRTILETQGMRQINADGSFIQKSSNYHRLMLHAYLFAVRIGASNGLRFSDALMDRLRRATDFLCAIQDQESGHVPNLGGNDGALILPLNQCDYRDFRGVCGAAQFMFRGEQSYAPGPWTEDLLWLFGPEALDSPIRLNPVPEVEAGIGGYHTLRGQDSWALLRCGTFRDRPAHADMLHLDLWWKGANIARDAGTFRYYHAPPWENALGGTDVHNTVMVDGRDQMDRGPRFMWIRWLRATISHRAWDAEGMLGSIQGEHDGYQRLAEPITHRRAVVRAGDLWVVIDDLIGPGEHAYTLHWLMDDHPRELDRDGARLTIRTPKGMYAFTILSVGSAGVAAVINLVRGTEESAPQGWISDYYGVRRPALSLTASARDVAPYRFVSLLGPAHWSARRFSSELLDAQGDPGSLRVRLNPPGDRRIVAGVRLEHENQTYVLGDEAR